MKFSFRVYLSEEDYLAYNKFVLTKSSYGKKQSLRSRLMMAVLMAGAALVVWLRERNWVSVIPFLLILIGVELFLPLFTTFAVKQGIKSQQRAGKPGYTPAARLDFSEDTFTETTPQVKSEYSYTALERVSLLPEKDIYLHLNNLQAYILPRTTFSSPGEYEEFVAFLSAKCAVIDRY